MSARPEPTGTRLVSQKTIPPKRISIKRIYQRLGSDAVLLPVRGTGKNGKGPIDKGWSTIPHAETQTAEYHQRLFFAKAIGVRLGKAGGGICVIDIDQDDGIGPFLEASPLLINTFRTRGSKGASFWVRMKGDYPHKIIKFRTSEQIEAGKKEHIAEFRTDGCQSVVRGLHPNGNYYQVLVYQPAIEIAWEDINWPLDWIRDDEKLSTKEVKQPSSGNWAIEAQLWERVRAYLDKCEPAISGQGGHNTTFRVTCAIIRGFGLCRPEALTALDYYNARCQPPWTSEELEHKVDDAFASEHQKLPGYLLRDANAPVERNPTKLEWLEALRQGILDGESLMTVKVTPRKRLLDVWFREGDTGFVYGAKGLGKTWLGYAIAGAISKGERLGPWCAGDGALAIVYLDGEMPLELMQERHKGLKLFGKNFYLVNHEILFSRTQKVFNIADRVQQKAITEICLETGAKVLFLDNLSTLASGVAESDADDWEKLQPWLLDLRRRKIAVVIIHHAGRSGLMRGTSRREDSVFWIIKLELNEDFDGEGCSFHQRFEKNRNAPRDPAAYTWFFKPVLSLGGPMRTEIVFEPYSFDKQFLDRLSNERATAKTLAIEFGASVATTFRVLNRLKEAGEVFNRKGYWYATGEPEKS